MILSIKSQYQQKPNDLESEGEEGQKIVSGPFLRISRAKLEYEPQFKTIFG